MSVAEIADNKWERESAKPPIVAVGSLAQLILISIFALLFLWIFSWCLMGIFGEEQESMSDRYGEMEAGAAPAAEE